MKTTFRTLTLITALLWLTILTAACSFIRPSPTAVPTPTITPTSIPVSHDGLWDGGTTSDATLSGELRFYVENNQVTEMAFSYTLRFNGCSTETVRTAKRVDQAKTTGNDFTARIDSYHERQLIITGTFASATEASGTLEFKGSLVHL